MPRDGFQFAARLRVRYSEVDAQGIVFNARYLDYADVALNDYWRWLKLADLAEWRGMAHRVARATLEFKAPFRHDDEVAAWTRTDRIGTSSSTMRVELCHAETGALHAVIEIVHVNVDLATGRPVAIPDAVRARLMPAAG